VELKKTAKKGSLVFYMILYSWQSAHKFSLGQSGAMYLLYLRKGGVDSSRLFNGRSEKY
jgi:hypothetical protein